MSIINQAIGRAYLFLRYGSKSKEIVDRDFMGDYSVAGGNIILQALLILTLSGACGLLIAALIFEIRYLCGIK